MNERLQKILLAALQAPSGDNCQPWRLQVRDRTVELYNLPGRDRSLYNERQRASLVAHGALLENFTLAASACGQAAAVDFFPESQEPDLVARIRLLPGEKRESPLAAAIPLRCTNRQRFGGAPLTPLQRNSLEACADGWSGARIILSASPAEQAGLAAMASRNDWLVFANRPLHQFLFEQLRWSRQHAEATRDGLDVATMGLSTVDRLGFPLLRYWPLVSALSRCGLPGVIGAKAQSNCRAASAVGAVIIPGCSAVDYLSGGQLMERLWLQATALGLQFQPYAGIAFLLQRLRDGESGGLTESSRATLTAILTRLEREFSLGNGVLLLFFRLGQAEPPPRSLRRRLDEVVTGTGE